VITGLSASLFSLSSTVTMWGTFRIGDSALAPATLTLGSLISIQGGSAVFTGFGNAQAYTLNLGGSNAGLTSQQSVDIGGTTNTVIVTSSGGRITGVGSSIALRLLGAVINTDVITWAGAFGGPTGVTTVTLGSSFTFGSLTAWSGQFVFTSAAPNTVTLTSARTTGTTAVLNCTSPNVRVAGTILIGTSNVAATLTLASQVFVGTGGLIVTRATTGVTVLALGPNALVAGSSPVTFGASSALDFTVTAVGGGTIQGTGP
jgi:hypothetical protein